MTTRAMGLIPSWSAAGFFISCEEAHHWYDRTFGIKLHPNHSMNVNITLRLEDAINKHNLEHSTTDRYHFEFEPIKRPNARWCDFLLTTQYLDGPFVRTGFSDEPWEGLKDQLPHREEDDKQNAVFRKDFGGWTRVLIVCPVINGGRIHTGESIWSFSG